MTFESGACGKGLAVLLAAGISASCASSPRGRAPAVSAGATSPEAAVRQRAAREFDLGRQAALQGDFPCAALHFARAIDAVRPADRPPPSDPETIAFTRELWESILRYEALAGPAEEAGNSDGQLSPEVEEGIESAQPSRETLEQARATVVTDDVGVTYDVPMVVNDEVLRVLSVFQTNEKVKGVITRALGRSGRYLEMIHRVFEEEGLPKDLAYLPIIESSFLPNARSYMSAHGIWQFMPRTGRHYGLSANAVVDERSDPEKSTRAAARYLSYLHELLGDWYLALAAYNAGEGKILRAMQRTGAKDFWALAATSAIRAQTKNYVPAYLAATLIARNPLHYGFEVEYEPPLAYETVTLERPVRLGDLAEQGGSTVEELRRLNPELRTAVTPRQPEGYELKVPPGQREAVLLAYAAAPTAKLPVARTHRIRKGDTLGAIARRYRVGVDRLASANGLGRRSVLRIGKTLKIPGGYDGSVSVASKGKRKARGPQIARAASKARPARESSVAKSYRVRGGDTLFSIARRHGTTVQKLRNANNLASSRIRAGQRLRIPFDRSR